MNSRKAKVAPPVADASVRGPVTRVSQQAEQVLRSLPDWFGIEESLLEYASNTETLPTFVAENAGAVVGFLSLREHFTHAWEIDCIAVDASKRACGIGTALLSYAEIWLRSQGATFLEVKTLAPSHPSEPYAQTRRFYEAAGFRPLEVLPTLWGAGLPVLIYLKILGSGGPGRPEAVFQGPAEASTESVVIRRASLGSENS